MTWPQEEINELMSAPKSGDIAVHIIKNAPVIKAWGEVFPRLKYGSHARRLYWCAVGGDKEAQKLLTTFYERYIFKLVMK